MPNATIAERLHQAAKAEHAGRFAEARDLLRDVTAEAEAPPDAALRLARLCLQAGPAEQDEAERLLTAARARSEREGRPRLAAQAVNLLALLALRRRRLDVAGKLLDDSPAHRLDGPPGPEFGQLYQLRGHVAAERGELAMAERRMHRAHQCYTECAFEQGLGEVRDALANLLLRRGKTRPALRFARLALEHKRKAGDRFGQAITLGTLGRIEQRLARYDEARGYFLEDLAIARELGDQRGVGQMLNSLGETALLQGRLDEAERHFRENLETDRGPINAFFANHGLARTLLAHGRTGAAAEALGALQSLMDASPSLKDLHELRGGLAGALAWRNGDLAEGERLLRQAVAVLRTQQHPLDAIPYLYELRDLHQSAGDTPRAVMAVAEALELWSECGSDRGVREVENWMRTADQPALVRLALERHLPPPLVKDILEGQLLSREPRLQKLTVLFSDIRDYTTLSEQLRDRPAELVELLNEWFTEATRAVRRHGGIVDKFIGDAVMALFGVPDERDDAAASAVRAALEMREALAALNLRQKVLHGPTLRIGVGIDTGEAVVGFIGSHLRQSYTAIGDLVNTASRLEGVTKDFNCDIIISQAAQDAQEKHAVAETVFQGPVQVKGRKQAVGVYKVLGSRGAILEDADDASPRPAQRDLPHRD